MIKMPLIRSLALLLLLMASFFVSAQTPNLSGKVIDKDTQEPLAFVNIIYNSQNQGTTTNIDGQFSIHKENITSLTLSYIGYEPQTVTINKDTKLYLIELQSVSYKLNEVTILPGINPAHRIIDLAIKNRDTNNPEKISSFSYTSYNKMVFTADLDNAIDNKKEKTEIDSTKVDSSFIRAQNFLDKTHLFITEAVSERKFIYPDFNDERVLGTKVSGVKNPTFAMLASQLQSSSFYKSFISIADKKYLNPISKGSTKKYFFLIEDTMYNENNDTTFIISYRPLKGRNFDGLKGILHINSNKYAIENVIAEPYDDQAAIYVKIQQKYEFIENKQWFPVQMNTNLIFKNANLSFDSGFAYLEGRGKTYIRDIQVNLDLNKSDFDNIEVEFDTKASKKDDTFWTKYRIDSLSAKDILTYQLIDSIGEAENFDLKLKVLEVIASGYIPYKFLNFDYTKILGFNSFEGLVPELNVITNDKVSKHFAVGGYLGYGFNDKHINYGGIFELKSNLDNELKLQVQYKNDVQETSGFSFIDDKSLSTSALYRNIYIESMDFTDEYRASLSFRTLQYLKLNFFYSNIIKETNPAYYFGDKTQTDNLNITYGNNEYLFSEVGLNLRYAFNEKFIKTPSGKFSMGTNFPVFWGNIVVGTDILGGNFSYTKLETKISKQFKSRITGKTDVSLVAGLVTGDIPYCNLYNGHGSYKLFSIESDNSFGTMRMNEFLSDKFVSLFLKHSFGPIFYSNKYSKPELVLVSNIGFGTLENKASHNNIEFRTMEKGYFESGFLFNNILRQSIFGYGVGIYYRYGEYNLAKQIDNLSIKMSFNVNL